MPDKYAPYRDELRRYGAQLLRAGRSVPDTLYHYTSAESCFSMIDFPFMGRGSPRMWASCALGMNDPGEIRYGIEVTKEVAAAFVPKRDLDHSFAPHWQTGDYTWMSFLETTCVACFCDQPDLLSQWRAYGRNGTGYCLGFDRALIEKEAAKSEFALVPIIYDPDQQRSILRELFAEARNALTENDPQAEMAVWRGAIDIAVRLSLAFKHQGFREECEWRLIATPQNITFRSGRWGVIPYVQLAFPRESLTCIWQGPTLDHDMTRRTLELYVGRIYGCGDQSIPNVAVHSSAIPLRKLDI